MKEFFTEPEIEIVSFEAIENVCAGTISSIPGGEGEFDDFEIEIGL